VRPGLHCVIIGMSNLISRCIYSVFLMHRREDLWGPDGQSLFGSSIVNRILMHFAALVFDPDRFLDDRLRMYLLPNPFIFLPFNAGPRICLGQQVILFQGQPMIVLVLRCSLQFAYNEVSLFLIRLLQAFSSISFAPDADPGSLPPASWAAGEARRPIERVWLKTHLILHAHVSLVF
jgi:hypothetical protein